MTAVQHSFQAEVSQVLRLVIHSLYSNPEIFLRELISNASDALDKRRFSSLQNPELLDSSETLRIRLIPDAEARTLTIWDNGIGMSDEELQKSLGTIAWSGSRDFLSKLEQARTEGKDLPQLIGQFGVGFYSAFLVANRVTVISRAAGSNQAFQWESSGEEGFTLAPAERDSVGTSVILHIKEEAQEYLEHYRLRSLVTRYSDYLSYPIELPKDDKEKKDEFETINRGTALWQRPAKDITPEQYEEFYKHLTHDWEAPLAQRHFTIEGTQMFTGLLYVPARAPFDLFDPEPRHGLQLHVKRVLIMENCQELLPRWLRFLRGVVDSEDLPLNVSREILQDSKIVRVIRKQVQNQALELLSEIAEQKPEDYKKFWEIFGAVLKEGLHFEPGLQDKLGSLVRYSSLQNEEPISLNEYLKAAPENQAAIYYITAPSQSVAQASPHLERVRAQGYDVLLMTDPVDPFAVENLREYGGKPLLSVTSPDLKLGDEEDKKDEEEQKASEPLLQRFSSLLQDRVSEVKASSRLLDSPACLIQPEGALSPQIERMLRAQGQSVPSTKRVLELNVKHPLIQNIQRLEGSGDQSEQLEDWVQLIYDQALLAEGSPLEEPAAFAQRITRLLTKASAAGASAEPPAQN